MKKLKLILSTHKLNKKTAALFRSYCHLLKPRLNSQWIINNQDDMDDVVVVDAEDDTLLRAHVKVKIILEKFNSSTVEHPKKDGKIQVFRLSYPINSSGMVAVLNKISSINIGSKKSKKTKVVINKLMESYESNITNFLKKAFIGSPGAGKTTAIANASTSKVLRTEVNTTDSLSLLKRQTTIGIDYGEYLLEDKIKLRLFGTPGQARYDFIRNQITKNADITDELIRYLKRRTPGFVLFSALDARDQTAVQKTLQEAAGLMLDSSNNKQQLYSEIT